jgi:hypothetical protein
MQIAGFMAVELYGFLCLRFFFFFFFFTIFIGPSLPYKLLPINLPPVAVQFDIITGKFINLNSEKVMYDIVTAGVGLLLF